MTICIQAGQRLPHAKLATLRGGELHVAFSSEIFAKKRAVIIGIPGAFTPVCSRVHLPKFIEMAPALHASGFSTIACISSNDP